jgi:hypothetical protein
LEQVISTFIGYFYEKSRFQITELYEDFHITKLPLLEGEVRGPQMISEFGVRLVNPPKYDG